MMQLPGVTNWSPDSCLAVVGGSSLTAILTTLSIVLGWMLGKAVSGIVSEYAKRIWFRRAHRSTAQKALDDLAQAKENFDKEKAEFAGVRDTALRLVEINRALRERVFALEQDNAELRQLLLVKPMGRRKQRTNPIANDVSAGPNSAPNGKGDDSQKQLSA